MEFLGINQIPFVRLFTKSDKLSRQELERSLKQYDDGMLANWEFMPATFVSSAVTKVMEGMRSLAILKNLSTIFQMNHDIRSGISNFVTILKEILISKNIQKMFGTAPMKIFSCRASQHLATMIADSLGIELGKSSVTCFSDGEFQPCFDESVRGCMVFIVQSTNPPADNLFELLLMIDAAKRASAYKVIAVIPYYGFARQDRKDRPRVSIGSKLSADLLSCSRS